MHVWPILKAQMENKLEILRALNCKGKALQALKICWRTRRKINRFSKHFSSILQSPLANLLLVYSEGKVISALCMMFQESSSDCVFNCVFCRPVGCQLPTPLITVMGVVCFSLPAV